MERRAYASDLSDREYACLESHLPSLSPVKLRLEVVAARVYGCRDTAHVIPETAHSCGGVAALEASAAVMRRILAPHRVSPSCSPFDAWAVRSFVDACGPQWHPGDLPGSIQIVVAIKSIHAKSSPNRRR